MNRFLLSFLILGLLPTLFSYDSAIGQEKDDPAKKELASLQGTWNFVFYEEKGSELKPGTRQFVISDKGLTYRSSDQDKVATTITIDSTQNPKRFTQTFPDGNVSNIIYLLADDYLLLCGHRDKSKWPSLFSCGTEKGGEFLIVLKRQP